MSKLGLLATITFLLGSLTFATLSAPASADDKAAACVHTDFKTELVKQACAKGGQKEAKDVMKAFMKDKKIKSCNQCHTKLAPKYELKADGLDQFTKAGGK
jgi:NAD(P)H-nitrite reductase large subunit